MRVYSLLIFGMLMLNSCERSDDAAPIIASSKVSFIYDDKLIVLDSFFINDIRRISTNEIIGKRVSAYQKSVKKVEDEYSFDFYFYTTDNYFELYGLELYKTEYFSSGGVISVTKSFDNIFVNDSGLAFSHDVEAINGNIQGNFEGQLVDHALYDTISVSNGKIKFLLP